jgi:hypothetical protein
MIKPHILEDCFPKWDTKLHKRKEIITKIDIGPVWHGSLRTFSFRLFAILGKALSNAL